jgi:vacuolar-type H+-ATPase subunit H
MDEHARSIADEHAKEYAELVKIRDNLHQKMSQWDKKLTESKDNIRKSIQNDAERQVKEIKGKIINMFLFD